MMATGTATRGMIAERQFCRNSSTTKATRITASRRVLNTSLIDSRDERRGVVDDRVVHALGKSRLELLHLLADQIGRLQGVGAGQLVDRQGHRGPAVERAGLVVALRASSIWATSRMRTMRPVASVFRIMSANCSASASRPSVVMVY